MMIDFGQQRTNHEQEITALFLAYLPVEPIPADLANRLKARVLQEVQNSFKSNRLGIKLPRIFQQNVTTVEPSHLLLGSIAVILCLLLVALFYWGQLLSLFF